MSDIASTRLLYAGLCENKYISVNAAVNHDFYHKFALDRSHCTLLVNTLVFVFLHIKTPDIAKGFYYNMPNRIYRVR